MTMICSSAAQCLESDRINVSFETSVTAYIFALSSFLLASVKNGSAISVTKKEIFKIYVKLISEVGV